jgi:predicted TIM-barrel fold metal-dependent hydrolase
MNTTLQLIDADAHVNPPPTFWVDYLPSRLASRSPKIEPGTNVEGHDWVVFEGTRKPFNIMSSVAGRAKKFNPTGRESELRKGGWEPSARLCDMDDDGVPTAVLYGGGPLGTSDSDLFVESFSAYNRWLADFCTYDPKRLVGVAYLPMIHVEQSVMMLQDAAKRGLRAVNIPAFPMSETNVNDTGGGFASQLLALTGDPNGKRHYDSPEFDPFWKAAVDHDMAISIHLGARMPRPGSPHFLPGMVMSKLTMAEPIAIMVFGGVFDRFPDLRFGSIESGVGWFPWLAEYMDGIWNNQNHWAKTPIKNPPSYYMDKNVYGSFIRGPIGIQIRHMVGSRNIMWSTDYPHSETTWPNSLAIMEEQFAGLSEEERRPIVYDNARRFYGLS